MSEPALPHEPAATDGVVPADDPEHAGSLRELLRIAVPLMISSGSVSVMHLANRMFLTRFSLDSVAAVLPAGILHFGRHRTLHTAMSMDQQNLILFKIQIWFR